LTPAQKLWARIIKPLFTSPSEPYPDRYATLKCQMQFGWDFAPRLRTCGIWDDVYVVVTRSAFIQDAWIKSPVKSQKSKVASISIVLTLDSDREQRACAVCSVRGKNFADDPQVFTFDLHLERGEQAREIAFDLIGAQFWNPWDRGDPNLYEIEISIADSKDAVLDAYTTTFGIRSFELARTAGAPREAEPWQFVINGEREFVRGANWVPMDAIPARLTRDDYAARLKQARDANINFLRVWGGGLKEKCAFYDRCDELGILVWQEFPFSGAALDRFLRDRAFLRHTREECSAVVRALRQHPSLVVWCGGNEFSTRGNQAVVKALRAVVKREDGTRPFKPASPYRDESHNWGVWHRFANLRDYRNDQTAFLSEFGLQSLPNVESLRKFLPDDALNAPHALWEYHCAELKKLGRYAQSPKSDGEIASSHPSTSLRFAQDTFLTMTVEEFVDATQRAQVIALQIAIEHMRRRKPWTTGVAVWQFNDCWPAISWSVVDYYGAPKRAYEELKRLYSPVLASFDYALISRRAGDSVHGDLWVINDLHSSFANAELHAYLNDQEIYARHVNITPDSAERVDALEVALGDSANILRLEVKWGPVTLSDHEYDLSFCDIGEVNLLDALLAAIGKRLMR
jgi:beta-mannosidase